MNLTPRDRRAILIGGSTLAVVVCWLYVVSPWLSSWSSARAAIRDADAAEVRSLADRAKLDTLARQLGPYYGGGLAEPLRPVSEVRIGFVKTVEELLKQNGMESKDVRSQPLQPIREIPGVGLVALDIECQGAPQSLVQALARLAQADRPILVQRMNTEPIAQRPDQLRVALTLATFAALEGTP